MYRRNGNTYGQRYYRTLIADFGFGGGLEKTTRSSPHHVAQHRPTGSETTPPYAPRSSRFGSEPLSVEDGVDVWRYAVVSCMPEMTTMGGLRCLSAVEYFMLVGCVAQW